VPLQEQQPEPAAVLMARCLEVVHTRLALQAPVQPLGSIAAAMRLGATVPIRV
jgi:hypothetical protein